MIRTISVPLVHDRLWLDSDVVYAQAAGWCGYSTANLRMAVIHHDSPDDTAPLPCLLWVCGGSWLGVDPAAFLPELIPLARRGYVLASAEYQNSSAAVFPAQVQQLKEAIRYLRAHAGRYRIDPERIGIIGESSGGHRAAMVGATNGRAEFEAGGNLDQSSAVGAVCAWYTPVDLGSLTELKDPVDRFLGCDTAACPEKAAAADPRTYLTPESPPFLLLHGTEDTLVPPSCSEKLYEALQARGVPADYYRIQGADHADYPFFQPQVMDLVAGFFDRYLKPEPTGGL
ncbi:MAG: alpha/beta hydrolase [Clostridiales bacterium]|nr:alpha/beta hydrolase [Clostridiales bacterium]